MRIFFLACLLSLVSFCRAQDTTALNNWTITFRPLGIADPFLANYTIGGQYKISKRFTAEINAGLIRTFYSQENENEDNITSSGYKLGAEVKFFLVRGFYVALSGFYNDYKRKSEEYVFRFAQTYLQEFDMERKIAAVGGHVKLGFVVRRNKKLFFDFYGGIGGRQKTIQIENLPDDAEIIDTGRFSPVGMVNSRPGTAPQKYGYASVALGVTVGYRF